MKKMFKIRIFQPVVQEYRVALYEGLAERYGDRIEIWAAAKRGCDVSVPLTKMRYDYSHPIFKFSPFVWQRGFSLAGIGKGDVVVVCGDIHQLSSLWIAFRARLKGIKVVWWGHHKSSTSNDACVFIRLCIARILSDVMLAYTVTGVKYLLKKGFSEGRVFATGNTINQRPIKTAVSHWTSEKLRTWQDAKGISSNRLILCCSMLRSKVQLDVIIRALSLGIIPSDVIMAVIGDGDKRTEWEYLAKELNVNDKIIWIGTTRDQEEMAPWFLSAKLFVYPGQIGLSILHAFSYGLPAVVHDNPEHQMPEYEVMEDGKTGRLFKENDVNDLSNVVNGLLADEPARAKMSQYSREQAFTRYSMDNMISNFVNAIEAAAAL